MIAFTETTTVVLVSYEKNFFSETEHCNTHLILVIKKMLASCLAGICHGICKIGNMKLNTFVVSLTNAMTVGTLLSRARERDDIGIL
jgi:ABC-type proline/glycine betaine transport system permease subunit